MSATVLPTPADGHLEEDRHRAELLDRLIDLRNALHASVSEIARLRRANSALRKDVARLERELTAARPS